MDRFWIVPRIPNVSNCEKPMNDRRILILLLEKMLLNEMLTIKEECPCQRSLQPIRSASGFRSYPDPYEQYLTLQRLHTTYQARGSHEKGHDH